MEHVEFTFLAEPASDYFCPVCTELLTDPYLTDCGHHVCYACLRCLLKRDRVDCPECREEDVLTDARLNRHFQRQVKNLQVRCKHHDRGCQWTGELKYMEEHLSDECKFAVVEFTITDFTSKKECNAEWVSPPFYSHPQYQFRLAVYPNGLNAQQGTDMSVRVLLDSPPGMLVEGHIGIELVDFRADYGSYSSVTLNDVPNTVSNTSTIIDYPNSMLAYNSARNTEYIQNDCVRFKVSLDEEISVFYYPTALLTKTPSWQISSPNQPSLLEFTLPEFTHRVEFLYPYYNCPDFYSHKNGYKLNFRVSVPHPIWHKYVSVYLTLVAGEYDDQLEWPFSGEFVIELLNWREDNAHYKKTLSFSDVDKVTDDAGGDEIADEEFIPYSLLDYDLVMNTEYLHADCLRFRISMN